MYKLTDAEELELKKIALQLRRNVLRIIKAGGAGHIGGALSATELMTALYFKLLNVDPKNPNKVDRDRFLMSAGHKCLIVYAALGEKGFFDKALFDTYFKINSKLPGHPDMHKLPGIESNTGSLGHGLPISVGMAIGLKLNNMTKQKVYTIMGDGELGEGTNWEAAAAASHHKADNLVVMIDRNKYQLGGPTNDIMNFEPLDQRWASFGWSVRSINGHDLKQIVDTLTDAPFEKGKPSLIICNTIKAKGFTPLEDKVPSHYWKVDPALMEQGEKDLELAAKELGI